MNPEPMTPCVQILEDPAGSNSLKCAEVLVPHAQFHGHAAENNRQLPDELPGRLSGVSPPGHVPLAGADGMEQQMTVTPPVPRLSRQRGQRDRMQRIATMARMQLQTPVTIVWWLQGVCLRVSDYGNAAIFLVTQPHRRWVWLSGSPARQLRSCLMQTAQQQAA